MLMRWNDPFKETKTLQSQINKLFGDISPLGVRLQGEEMPAAMWAPPVDVTETKDVLAFKFEVPGFKQEELTLNVENGALTLEGERKFEEEQKDKNYHRVERSLRAVLPLVRSAGEPRRVEGLGDSRRRRPQRRAPKAGRGEAEIDPHRDRLAQAPRAQPQSGLRVPESALRRQAGAMKTGRRCQAPPVAFPGHRDLRLVRVSPIRSARDRFPSVDGRSGLECTLRYKVLCDTLFSPALSSSCPSSSSSSCRCR